MRQRRWPAVDERAGEWRVGVVRFRTGRRPRSRAAAAPAPRRAITGVPVINGTRAGPASTTGTGITATTGNARRGQGGPWATDPGDSRRRGRRRSRLHRRGRPGASVMWNQTANGWGFWNNEIWTPV